jgi:hypothetical protein
MALTRPRLGQLNTSVVAQADPITVLNQGSSSANVDVGFLFNRANGLVSNVALYWSESAQSIVTAYTTSTGSTNANISVASYANLTVGNVLLVTGSILNVQGNITANTLGTHYGNIVSTTANITTANIAGDAYIGGNLLVVGNITTLNREIVTSVEIVSGNLVANSGTASTNTTTGALVVTGGAGITGNLNVGGQTALGNGVNLYNTGGSVLNITGNTFGDGGNNSGANALVYISQTNSWSGNQPWSLYVTGYSYMNGFRINGQDSPRALHKSITGNLGFSTSDATSGITFGPQNGTTAFAVYPPTSGATVVNYLQVTGAAVNTSPTISALGTNANIDIVLQAQGNGNITTANIVRFTNTNTSTSTNTGALVVAGGAGIAGNLFAGNSALGANMGNYLQVNGAVAGSAAPWPILSTQGTDSTVHMWISTKGQGAVRFQSQAGAYTQLRIDGTVAAYNALNIFGGASGVGPTLGVIGNDTNSDLNLSTNGTGNVQTTSPVRITNANVSTSTGTGALIVAGGAGISGNVFTGGYVYATPTSVTDVAGGTYGTAIAVPGSNWGIYANIGQTGTYYFRQVIGKDTSNNIIVGHTGTTSLNANINIWPGSGGTGYFNVINPFSTNPVFSVNTTANTVVVANAQASTSNVTGALQVAGGVGIGGNINASGNIYALGTNTRHGYTWANSVSSAYTVFNSSTNSVDTVFG